MAFGDNPNDAELRDAWHAFCDQVKGAGDLVFKDVSGTSDGERTNAFRYLTQNLSQAFDIFLENRDTRFPNLHAFCGPTRKLGCDNADAIYLQSWINDTDTYRISGTLGTARMANFALQGPWLGIYHEPFGDTPIANLFGHELETGWDGSFELWVSPEPHEGNWIRTVPGARKLFLRQFFDHWDEVPANYRIERVGGEPDLPPAIEPAWLVESFAMAGEFVEGTVRDWPDLIFGRDGNAEHPNTMIRHGAESDTETEAVDSRRGRMVETMYWDLDRDEALVLELDAKPHAFWQVTACTVFGASLDYRNRQVSLTSGMAPVDADGTTRVVLAHDDPGYANWIDTQDHTRGWLYLRNVLTRETPDVRTRVVRVADLDAEIGAVATRIAPDERRAELARRRAAIRRRFPN